MNDNKIKDFVKGFIKTIIEHDKLTTIYKFFFFFIKLAFTIFRVVLFNIVLGLLVYLFLGNKLVLLFARDKEKVTYLYETIQNELRNIDKYFIRFFKLIGEKTKDYYQPVHKYVNLGLGYIILLLLPVLLLFRLLNLLPPWAKAILSSLVWGLGQLLNRQYIKAALFAGALAVVILIEINTGTYGEEFNLYDDRIPGEELPVEEIDYWAEWYYYGHIDYVKSQIELPDGFPGDIDDLVPDPPAAMNEWYDEYDFLEYVAEVNDLTFSRENFNFKDHRNSIVEAYDVTLTQEQFYEYIALEILAIEAELEEEGVLADVILQAETDATDRVESNVQLRLDEESISSLKASEGYQEAFDLKFDELLVTATEAKYCTFGQGFICADHPDFEATKEAFLLELNSENKLNQDILIAETNEVLAQPYRDELVTEKYQAYIDEETNINYSYYYGLSYNAVYGDLILENDSIRSLKEMFSQRLSNAQLTFNQDAYNKMLTRIYFEMYPEEYEDLIIEVNNEIHERSGFFVKGVWGAITLGTADQKNLDVHKSRLSFLDFSFAADNYEAREIPISGHLSDKLMLRGIIAILTVVYVLVIYVWNIRDAYKSGKYLQENKEPEPENEYFASLYEEMFEYIVLTPALILVTFISVMPILFGLAVAFTNFNIENLPPSLISWVGLENFKQVFTLTSGSGIDFGGQFWKVASWTLIWAIAATFTCFFGGFVQAVIINNKRVVFRKMWRSILILPWAVPALISQMIFRVVFNDLGYVNQTLSRLGITQLFTNMNLIRPYDEVGTGIQKFFYFGEETFQWLTNEANPWFVRIFIIVLNVWLGFPFFMALMSGVMTSIDKSLYEAASIDGATGFQQFKFITMPLVLFATSPLLVMTFSGNFNNFGVIYFITGGGPGGGTVDTAYAGSTDILISWIYKLTTDANIRWYSMASVFSILIFLIVGTLSAWNFTRTRAFKEGD